eukprot:357022-Chlamydomonas_euryale.AAC.4
MLRTVEDTSVTPSGALSTVARGTSGCAAAEADAAVAIAIRPTAAAKHRRRGGRVVNEATWVPSVDLALPSPWPRPCVGTSATPSPTDAAGAGVQGPTCPAVRIAQQAPARAAPTSEGGSWQRDR